MSITVNQTAVGSNMTGSNVSSISAGALNQSAGHLIVVGVRQYEPATGTYTQTVSDTAGNTYTPLPAEAGTPGQLQLFYCLNCLGNSSNIVKASFLTSGVSGVTAYVSIFVWDVIGTSLTLDSSATANGTNTSSTATTGSFSTIGTSEIVLALETINETGGPNATAGSGYSLDSANINGTGTGGAEHQIFSSTQSGITASFGLGTSIAWIIVSAAFYEAAGAISATIDGTSSVTAALNENIAATINGTSSVTANLTYTLTVNINGTSTVTCSLGGKGAVAASINGTSSVSASIGSLVFISASIEGTSSVTASFVLRIAIQGKGTVICFMGPPAAEIPLPFDIKTTALVTILSCYFAAGSAIGYNAAINSIGYTTDGTILRALQFQYAMLFSVYQQLLQQNSNGNATGIHAAIVRAAGQVATLNAVMQSIPSTSSNEPNLSISQSVVAAGLVTMNVLSVQSIPPSQ